MRSSIGVHLSIGAPTISRSPPSSLANLAIDVVEGDRSGGGDVERLGAVWAQRDRHLFVAAIEHLGRQPLSLAAEAQGDRRAGRAERPSAVRTKRDTGPGRRLDVGAGD